MRPEEFNLRLPISNSNILRMRLDLPISQRPQLARLPRHTRPIRTLHGQGRACRRGVFALHPWPTANLLQIPVKFICHVSSLSAFSVYASRHVWALCVSPAFAFLGWFSHPLLQRSLLCQPLLNRVEVVEHLLRRIG